MSDDGEIRDRQVRWLDLAVPRRSLERRVRRSAHLDALRGVRGLEPGVQATGPASGGPAAAPAPAGPYLGHYPAAIGEIAAWEASTLRALGAQMRSQTGRRDARIGSLQARIRALGPPPEVRLAAAARAALGEAVTASSPQAQARRRERLDAHLWAAADGERVVLQAELAEEMALRTGELEAAREAARQCHESASALQHLYWAVRTRWSRRRHGAPPVATFAHVPLPDWVTTPQAPSGAVRHDGTAA